MPQKKFKKILFMASTMPISAKDPVPAFVRDEAIWFKKTYPFLKISVLSPHNAHSDTKKFTKHKEYDDYRFHYFWPYSWEKLTGRGIAPALKQNKLLYIQVPFLLVCEFFATIKLVRKTKPDLIYAHWFTPQAIVGSLVSKMYRIPFVFDTQSSDVIVLKKIPFSKNIVSAVCKRAHAYTAPSKQTVDKLLYFSTDKNRGEIKKKLHLIPLGTAPVEVKKSTIKRTIEKYGLKNKRTIYFIGRLVDRKGIDVLIKSFRNLYAKNEDLRLVIVGDGQEREKFKNLAARLGLGNSVIFAGYITGEERFALLNIASIGVVPSVNVGDHAEGLPIVFMEGLTAGKAMVVSDATGAHEVVHDGKDAFVTKAGSVNQLTEKMQLALRVSERNDKEFYKNVLKLAEQFQWPAIIKRRYEAFQITD